ncbi:aldo/keto reductase, partial [Micromonospora sp. DH15]|nr:aldo/keto reductase [Micromonospora sp. DH15]
GITEQIIGRWFAQGGGRREKVVLATKVYGKMGDWPNEQGLSARHIIRACEDSLRRLQTDVIDLYQMHHVSRATPWEEIWQAMETLVAQGKVVYVGSSNFAGWHIGQAQAAAQRRNFLGLVSEQSIYNLLTRAVELEVVPAAQHYGLGIIPWSPLHGGLLSGALRKMAEGGAARSAAGRAAEGLAEHRPTIEAYEKFCADLGHDPADVALGWLLSRPGVTAPIIGPRTIDQLDRSLGALDVRLDEAALARLDELFPPVGKGGPGPEAWAW